MGFLKSKIHSMVFVRGTFKYKNKELKWIDRKKAHQENI